MSGRRSSLPGADELFRSTTPLTAPAPSGPAPSAPPATAAPVELRPVDLPEEAADAAEPAAPRRRRSAGDRRPSGRERHEEKITVYCSAEELIDLERARLTLRGDHGLAVDRGRIVREALSMILEDLEAKGDQSTLVRRLRGR